MARSEAKKMEEAAELIKTAQRALACMVLENQSTITVPPYKVKDMVEYGKKIRKAVVSFENEDYEEVESLLKN